MIFRKLPHVADYPETVMRMETHVDHMLAGFASEEVWLLEHPNIYTLGSSAKDSDVLSPDLLPLYRTGRGGQVTYHGTGQRIAYVMIDLSQRKQDLHWYVQMLEEWLIMTLKDLGIKGERRRERVGIWVSDEKGREQKVAAIGVRVKKWITFHGISLNVNPDLSYYQNIIPCGLSDYGVTSLHDRGVQANLHAVDDALEKNFRLLFDHKYSPTNSSPTQFSSAQSTWVHDHSEES
jgi:lipoyl(octanoyl) transferase